MNDNREEVIRMEQALHADRLMSVEDVAEFLQVRQSWVYGKVASGELPHVRVGRYLRFRRQEVLEWLARRER